MEKQEAIEFMKKGGKVTHRYFSDGEWMAAQGLHRIVFEDGVSMEAWNFWEGRGPEYLTDWSEFKEDKKI